MEEMESRTDFSSLFFFSLLLSLLSLLSSLRSSLFLSSLAEVAP